MNVSNINKLRIVLILSVVLYGFMLLMDDTNFIAQTPQTANKNINSFDNSNDNTSVQNDSYGYISVADYKDDGK